MSHNERCKECKIRVRELLEKIYGPVITNYRIKIGTRPEDFRDYPRYPILNEIFASLQKHRGFTEFVRASYVDVDFFLPEQGMIIEFDESQHFTEPRKITLSHYPSNLEIGFSCEAWMKHCDEIRAYDNDPPFRDEQRAWYDTLRDFIPEVKGFHPTIRLFARDMAWCSLDANDANDIRKFKSLIESRCEVSVTNQMSELIQIPKQNWIATVILKSNLKISDEKDPGNNPIRISEMEQILRSTIEKTSGDGVILFPGGWVHTQHERAESIYPKLELCVKEILTKTDRNIKVCIGIDGFFDRPLSEDPYDQDQMAITIDKTGIIAICRKFYPSDDNERKSIILAKNCYDGELGKPRIFELNGIRYFPFVCYDVYGPWHEPQKYLKPDANIGLNLIHRFRPKGEFLNQENYFPLNGWSEASCQWKIPVFGTSIFFRRSIPSDWPTGIIWTGGDVWKKPRYPDISLPHDSPIITIPLTEGSAEVRIFTNIPGKIKSMRQIPVSESSANKVIRTKKDTQQEYWTESGFIARLLDNTGSEKTVEIAKKLIGWARNQKLDLGETCYIKAFIPFAGTPGKSQQLFRITANGKLAFEFRFIDKYPQFESIEKRQQLVSYLNTIKGLNFSTSSIKDLKSPSYNLIELLEDSQNFESFVTMSTWFFDELRKGRQQ